MSQLLRPPTAELRSNSITPPQGGAVADIRK